MLIFFHGYEYASCYYTALASRKTNKVVLSGDLTYRLMMNDLRLDQNYPLFVKRSINKQIFMLKSKLFMSDILNSQ